MNILDFNKFKVGFEFIQFSFNIPTNAMYIRAIYSAICQDITSELFVGKCFNLSAKYTKQEFFKEYGNTPTVKDYIKILLPEKKTRYREKLTICGKYELTQPYFGYPDDYQKQIDDARKNLNINCQQLEGQHTTLNKKNNQPYIGAINTNFIEQKTLDDMVEDQIQKFLGEDIKHHFQLEQAKNEKWLGYGDIRKNDFGLLGYYRTNIAFQIRILENLSNGVGIPRNHACFASFFKSDWFKNAVLKNGYVSFNVYKKSHFEVIKNEDYYQSKEHYLKFYS